MNVNFKIIGSTLFLLIFLVNSIIASGLQDGEKLSLLGRYSGQYKAKDGLLYELDLAITSFSPANNLILLNDGSFQLKQDSKLSEKYQFTSLKWGVWTVKITGKKYKEEKIVKKSIFYTSIPDSISINYDQTKITNEGRFTCNEEALIESERSQRIAYENDIPRIFSVSDSFDLIWKDHHSNGSKKSNNLTTNSLWISVPASGGFENKETHIELKKISNDPELVKASFSALISNTTEIEIGNAPIFIRNYGTEFFSGYFNFPDEVNLNFRFLKLNYEIEVIDNITGETKFTSNGNKDLARGQNSVWPLIPLVTNFRESEQNGDFTLNLKYNLTRMHLPIRMKTTFLNGKNDNTNFYDISTRIEVLNEDLSILGSSKMSEEYFISNPKTVPTKFIESYCGIRPSDSFSDSLQFFREEMLKNANNGDVKSIVASTIFSDNHFIPTRKDKGHFSAFFNFNREFNGNEIDQKNWEKIKQLADTGDMEAVFLLSFADVYSYTLQQLLDNDYAPAYYFAGLDFEQELKNLKSPNDASINGLIEFYKIAASKGVNRSYSRLGKIFETAEYTENDLNRAVEFYQIGAEKSDYFSTLALVELYLNNDDLDLARENLLKFKYPNDPKYLYLKAKVDLESKNKNLISEALVTLDSLANKRNFDALYTLGEIYQYGKYGVEINIEKSFEYHHFSAQLGNVQSMVFLSLLYLDASFESNYVKHRYWARRALATKEPFNIPSELSTLDEEAYNQNRVYNEAYKKVLNNRDPLSAQGDIIELSLTAESLEGTNYNKVDFLYHLDGVDYYAATISGSLDTEIRPKEGAMIQIIGRGKISFNSEVICDPYGVENENVLFGSSRLTSVVNSFNFGSLMAKIGSNQWEEVASKGIFSNLLKSSGNGNLILGTNDLNERNNFGYYDVVIGILSN